MTYPIPDELLDLRQAIFGRAGAGKTVVAKGEVERLLTLKRRLCVVDPLGVWYGLRSAPDGKGKGFDIPVLGGPHGDIPITEDMGKKLGFIVGSNDFSCVIDLSSIRTKSGWRKFMTAFLGALYEHNNQLLHLVLDEADLWAPQKLQADQFMLFHQVDEIVRRGRVLGFIPILISQRPAVINKDVLSQIEMLVAMCLPAPQDRNAIGAWLDGQVADPVAGQNILDALPKLQRGEGWIWAPGADLLKRVAFPMIRTYDSSRTPSRGEKVQGISLPKIDMSAIAAALAEPTAKGKKSDAKDAGFDAGYAAGYENGHKDGAVEAQDQIAKLQGIIQRLREAMRLAAEGLSRELVADDPHAGAVTAELHEHKPFPPGAHVHELRPSLPATAPRPVPRAKPPARAGVPGELGGLAKTFLATLAASHPARMTWPRVAVLSGRKSRGAQWNAALGQLRAAGLVVEQQGQVWLSEAGCVAGAADMTRPKTPAELLAMWSSKLGGMAAKMLLALVQVGPRLIEKEELARMIERAPRGAQWNAALSALKSNGLAEQYGSLIKIGGEFDA